MNRQQGVQIHIAVTMLCSFLLTACALTGAPNNPELDNSKEPKSMSLEEVPCRDKRAGARMKNDQTGSGKTIEAVVGSTICTEFWARNTNSDRSIKGFKVIVTGEAVDGLMISKPQLTLSTDGSGANSRYVDSSPATVNLGSAPKWLQKRCPLGVFYWQFEAPNLELARNGVLHVSLNGYVAKEGPPKLGGGDLVIKVFHVTPAHNTLSPTPGGPVSIPLIFHQEFIKTSR
ncbi:MAG: hypothetical protein C5B53_10540 [Candidatus Melainabacteria bacterium]|nr:MAG: hypothetical protein C5B53_10540 [Candidatus Melainabacteria bacterium]